MISGFEFSTLTEAEAVSVPPSASVAVTVQVMVSPGELVDEVSVTVLPEPSVTSSLVLVHA